MTTFKKLSITAAFTVAFCGVANAQWQTVAPAGAGFSVQMPGAPEYSSQTVSTAAGSVPLNAYVYEKGGEAYFVAYSNLPSGMRMDLDRYRDGAFKNGKVLSESPSTLNGYPARMIIGTVQQYHAILKLALVNGKLFQVLYLSSGQPSPTNTAAFFDSFNLTTYARR